MKKYLLVLFAIIIFTSTAVYAETKTATATPTSEPTAEATGGAALDKEVQNLKDKIAKKVEELNKNKKALAGIVEEISEDYIKISTEDNQTYKIKIDPEITKIYTVEKGDKTELKLKDIKKQSYIIVTGIVLDSSIDANSIYKDEQLLVKSGRVVEVNKSDYNLKIVTNDKDNLTLDIETSTRQYLMNIKTLDIEKTGFSKIKEGDVIHFVIKKGTDQEEKNRFPVLKFLIIPQEYF